MVNDITGIRPAGVGCTTTPRPTQRNITFEVVDSNGFPVGPIPVSEVYTSVTTNSCRSDGRGPDPSVCLLTDGDTSRFTDSIAVNCGYLFVGCGYDITHKWQWCPTGRTGAPFILGTLMDNVRSNQITVNGNSTSLTIGTEIFP